MLLAYVSIDSGGVKLILTSLFAFESKRDFYNEIYCSTYFHVNVSKHKPVYIQLIFTKLIHLKSIFVTVEPNIH